MKKRKSHMTLLEVMIAMMLLSGLLVIVFGFFRELSVLNQLSKESLQESFKQRYMESRLSYVFSNIANENYKAKGKDYFQFFTLQDEASKHPSLIITFYNGSSLDTNRGGQVVGRLFVDSNNTLCLATWPYGEDRDPMMAQPKIEYLRENVKNISFHFLSAPNTEHSIVPPPTAEGAEQKPVKPGEKQEEPEKNPPKGQWLTQWEKEYKQMPIIVKLDFNDSYRNSQEITLENNKNIFSFVLPSSKNPIKFVPVK